MNIPIWHIPFRHIKISQMHKAIYSTEQEFAVSRLKIARLEAGLTQKDVARLLGRTQSHVSKIEAGQRRIDVTTLNEMARVYKKKLTFFLK